MQQYSLGPILGHIAGKPVQANQVTRKGARWDSGRMTPSDGQDTTSQGVARRITEKAHQIVIYWSRSGATELLASKIANLTNSDVCQITLTNPYPADYLETRTRANRERDTGLTPDLNMQLPDLTQYETVYLGFQTWAMTLSEPLKAFLQAYGNELSGKRIMPFETNGGYGIGNCLDVMSQLLQISGATNYTIERPLTIAGNQVDVADTAVREWCD